MKTLVVGYGNCTRGDDGAGVYTAELIEEKKWPGVEVRTTQQLSIDLLEDFPNFERVVLIDVSPDIVRAILRKVDETDPSGSPSSHHLSPGHLLKLAISMGYAKPDLYICMIPGGRFDFSTELSTTTREQAHVALGEIEKLILKNIVIPAKAGIRS